MASILAIEDGENTPVENEAELRGALIDALRVGDEAIMLPGASRSAASLSFKNVVMTLGGAAPAAPFRAFSSDWGHGVSVIRVPTDAAERVLASTERRQGALRALVGAIPNELAGGVDVGPGLDSTDARDVAGDVWTAGFDGGGCCCGLYSATELRPTIGAPAGMTRAHKSYFLLAKAGAGRAAQEFHQTLGGLAASGQSLDAIFSGASGRALSDAHVQRVAAAGRRNRGRLILAAAEVLGLSPDVDSVPDHACCVEGVKPTAILMADSVTNTLERVPASAATDGSVWRYYAGAIATTASQGAASCSSAMEGFVLFLSPEASGGSTGTALRVRNVCHGAIPFGSRRAASARDALTVAVAAHRRAARASGDAALAAHPDSEWVRSRFGWKTAVPRRQRSEKEGDGGLDAAHIEPPQLWGSHAPIEASAWTLQLGMSGFRAVVLSPEVVALAGAEPTVLRAAVAARA